MARSRSGSSQNRVHTFPSTNLRKAELKYTVTPLNVKDFLIKSSKGPSDGSPAPQGGLGGSPPGSQSLFSRSILRSCFNLSRNSRVASCASSVS